MREEGLTVMPVLDEPELEGLLLTMPILARMRPIEGWLTYEEADLLIAAAARALAVPCEHAAIVEVGSYRGRSTVVLGSVARAVCPRAMVYAIDPHEGQVGIGAHTLRTPPTFQGFSRNIAAAGLNDVVQPIVKNSYEVVWNRPIRLLFIDGHHDYASVKRDFYHFERWVEPGGYVAFHDYSNDFPGVVAFVDEMLAAEPYRPVCRAGTLIVTRKRSEHTGSWQRNEP